jgi:hypothetical protein
MYTDFNIYILQTPIIYACFQLFHDLLTIHIGIILNKEANFLVVQEFYFQCTCK